MSPKDRDQLEAKAPPASVSVQIAKPLSASPLPGSADVDDYTGQYRSMPEEQRDPKKLKDARRTRTPSESIEKLEERADRHDDLLDAIGTKVDELVPAVAKIDGKLEFLPKFMEEVTKSLQDRREVQHIKLTAEADVETAKAKAEITDKLDAKKSRRRIWTRILTGAGIAGAGYLTHFLMSHLL